MTKEELIKDQFPNDEFLQSGVLRIVDKCTAYLEKELREKILNEKCSMCRYNTVGQDEYIHILEEQNKDLEKEKCELLGIIQGKDTTIKDLTAQIEKMKSDLLELKEDSYDAGMFLRVDELVQKWEIKEK